jgi:hypothetical protein
MDGVDLLVKVVVGVDLEDLMLEHKEAVMVAGVEVIKV